MKVTLKNNLDDYIRDLDGKIGKGIQRGAFRIEGSAKSKAPVDTGNLRRSIEAHMTGDLEAEIIANAEYAGFVELGARNTAPQPFMLPAFDAEKDNVIQDIKDALN